jgi:serine/threonine protein phosphatase PrpC
MPDTPGIPKQEIKLFYCYAHEDKALRDELQVNLSGLRRQYQLTNWYDREILPGEKWEEIIDKNLSTADVILLLISPHFVDSDYCYGKEMQRALERHHAGSCCVIPILLRPTYWEETPLSTIQMLPTDARPITSWSDRYEAFHDVARSVSVAIKALLTARARKTKEEESRQAQLKRFWKAHKLPTEDILINTYQDIQRGTITSPSEIRAIASAFQTIANDSFASQNVPYDAARAAAISYGRAREYEEKAQQVQKAQLYLDVAQLTDVGRKREHNEDNMAFVIPKDSLVMAKKGALFVVADGGASPQGGEVASEIAVDTISNLYYQNDSDDVAASLLHAIKHANAQIRQRAAENMLRSGMSTTCVAAVFRGNVAYIANVGNSRAYLVRYSQIKQVTLDHSWVAEQVRAGLLTEDQARKHPQRNVITRWLGDQADIEIDVFSEQLEEKDTFVLCTDGLARLVSNYEIQRIVDQSGPPESVYHLVERANENGGDDNITAVVVHINSLVY